MPYPVTSLRRNQEPASKGGHEHSVDRRAASHFVAYRFESYAFPNTGPDRSGSGPRTACWIAQAAG